MKVSNYNSAVRHKLHGGKSLADIKADSTVLGGAEVKNMGKNLGAMAKVSVYECGVNPSGKVNASELFQQADLQR